MNKKLRKNSSVLAATMVLCASIGTSSFADEISTFALSKAFSGKNNIISGSEYTSGSKTFKTEDSQGTFTCWLNERFAGDSPDKNMLPGNDKHKSNRSTTLKLDGGTYYMRYEGASTNAKTLATFK